MSAEDSASRGTSAGCRSDRPPTGATASVTCEDFSAILSDARRRLPQPGPVDVGVLWRCLGDQVPRAVFDECLLRLEREGALALIPHARPETLDALELRDCVPSSRGPLYFVLWRG
jgi:hypothetical protein